MRIIWKEPQCHLSSLRSSVEIAVQLENALIVGDPDSPEISLKLCDFGYSKDELVSHRFMMTQPLPNPLSARPADLIACTDSLLYAAAVRTRFQSSVLGGHGWRLCKS